MGQSKVPLDANTSKEMRAFLDGLVRNLGSLTPADVSAAGLTQIEHYSGLISLPTNKDYHIVERLPFGYTVTGLTTKTSSGTCTVTAKINSTAVTGGAIASTSSQQTSDVTANNVAVEGDTLTLTISSNSSAVDLSFTVEGTRELSS